MYHFEDKAIETFIASNYPKIFAKRRIIHLVHDLIIYNKKVKIMNKEYHVRNSDGDFLQVQNFVLQLVAEKKLTHTAFVLYSFYRSIAGFDEIKMGYRYIEENCGVSKASISKCNRMLVGEGLIKNN